MARIPSTSPTSDTRSPRPGARRPREFLRAAVTILLIALIGSLPLLPTACRDSRDVRLSLRIHALDARGAEVRRSILYERQPIGGPTYSVPFRWDEFTSFNDADLVFPTTPWPPPAPLGARALTPCSHSIGDGRLDVVAHETVDAALVLDVRFERRGRVAYKSYEFFVGDPTARLHPTQVTVKRRIANVRTSSGYRMPHSEPVLHLEFR